MTGAYSYQIGGPPRPADVSGFAVSQTGDTVVMTWTNNNESGIKGFDIYYGPQTEDINSANLLTEETRATEITTAKVPPGDWAFFIVAKDLAGQVSVNPASVLFTVVNNNTVISKNSYVPSYSDEISPYDITAGGFNFFRHWTGKMIPKSVNISNAYSQISPPDIADITLDSVSGGSFDAANYFMVATYVTAAGETLPSAEVSIAVDAGFLPTAFIPASAFPATAKGWNIYVSTSSGIETKQNDHTLGNYAPDGLIVSNNKVDEIWQLPVTGLTAGSSAPIQNTTGWEVFNVFVPDPEGAAQFVPVTEIDTGVQARKRVWVNLELIAGPGQQGIQTENNDPILNIGGPVYLSSSPAPMPQPVLDYQTFNIGFSDQRYLLPIFFPWMKENNVFYINKFEITVDNAPATTAVQNVSISSAGTTINYSDYGLAYHQNPAIQITPASSAATSGIAIPSSTSAALTLYNGTTPVTGVANIAITGV